MSPQNIITEAIAKKLDIIGITDHNSTRQANLIKTLGEKQGLFVMCGAEVTSKEEVHSLTFFPDNNTLSEFQDYIDKHLPDIKNDTDKFGYQVCVNVKEDIIFEEDRLLITGINQTIEQIEAKVHEINGIFIPAHINRPSYSLLSQLGFVNPDLKVDALELSKSITIDEFKKQNSYLKDYTFIQNSDAHQVKDIGTTFSEFIIHEKSFKEIKMALQNINGRHVSSIY